MSKDNFPPILDNDDFSRPWFEEPEHEDEPEYVKRQRLVVKRLQQINTHKVPEVDYTKKAKDNKQRTRNILTVGRTISYLFSRLHNSFIKVMKSLANAVKPGLVKIRTQPAWRSLLPVNTPALLRKYSRLAGIAVFLLLFGFFIRQASNSATDQPQTAGQSISGTALPTTFVNSTQQDLYYPAQLPSGYHISADATVINDTLATYTITTPKGGEITINHQQNIPEQAFMMLFQQAETLEMSHGTGYIAIDGKVSSRAGLYTASVSVLINSPDPIPATDMQLLLKSLQKY